MTRRRTRPVARRGLVLALLAGVVIGATLATGGAAVALWTTSAPAATRVATGAVGLSATDLASLQRDYTASVPAVTGSWSFTNTGTVDADYSTTASLASGSSAALASSISVVAWPVARGQTPAAACTASAAVGAGSVSGTWAAPPRLGGSLAAGASVAWCLRSSTSTSSPLGRVTPVLTASLAAGSWRAPAQERRFVQNNTVPPRQTATCSSTDIYYAWLDFDPSDRPIETTYGSFVGSTRVGTATETGHYPHFAFTRETLPKNPYGDGRITVDIRVVVDGVAGAVAATGVVVAGQDPNGLRNIQCP
ncbi:hypothetical protein ASF17_05865 [Frigoribacterium sp. Leaf263]|uniref:hypothetical protein n=1 Tax=Frigoribacterium sp. Leaf263 TaxID=1736313 RepID=UPI0006F4BBD5|nr:hypothetical protein [Frigoribacterium sp. Leaf263]KQO82583.1 hypothetical protein ASF17_05865 [Frigoribacterium sp. Leaf263]